MKSTFNTKVCRVRGSALIGPTSAYRAICGKNNLTEHIYENVNLASGDGEVFFCYLFVGQTVKLVGVNGAEYGALQ